MHCWIVAVNIRPEEKAGSITSQMDAMCRCSNVNERKSVKRNSPSWPACWEPEVYDKRTMCCTCSCTITYEKRHGDKVSPRMSSERISQGTGETVANMLAYSYKRPEGVGTQLGRHASSSSSSQRQACSDGSMRHGCGINQGQLAQGQLGAWVRTNSRM